MTLAPSAGLAPIALLRLDNADPELLEELLGAVGDIAAEGAFTLGTPVADFETAFAAYCDAAHAVGVSSGTEALVLAFRALGMGGGDEVIVPANSFIATAEAVTLAGGRPKLVDVDPLTGLLTAPIVADAMTERVRAVAAVHLFGRTVDIEPILEVTAAASVPLVEDAAQAHGAIAAGRRVGGIGTVGCFSFYPTKNLGGWGDGGAVVTNDPEIADRVRLLRSHGERPRYHHLIPGTTARLDALQAAVLQRKLLRLDGWNDRRRALASTLTAGLEGGPVVTPAQVDAGADHVYHLYVVRTAERDALRSHLEAHNVASAVHYPVPIHRTGAYSGLGTGTLAVTERLAREIVTLPLHPYMTDDEAQRIIAAVQSFPAKATTLPDR